MEPAASKLSLGVMQTLDALWRLEKVILDTLDFREVVQKVADAILFELNYLELGYRVVVLALVDEEKQILRRVALSRTEEARRTREVSELPFEKIVIPLTAEQNLCIRVLKEGQPQVTHSFPDILTPPLSPENALASQRNAGIKTSLVYPLGVRGKRIGVMIFSLIKDEEVISPEEKLLLRYFTDLAALSVQNSRLYSDLETKTKDLVFANEKLKELDQLKDEFVSITSHELRTPMAAIKSYLWLVLAGKGGLPAQAGGLEVKSKAYVERAYQATGRLINLVNEMLDISRMEAGRMEFKMEIFSLADLVKEVCGELLPKAAEKGLYLKTEEGEAPPVRADRGKVRQVLLNLVGNAVKFTEKGGVVIKFKEGEGYFIRVEVVDTGPGVALENQSRLFKKFSRLEGELSSITMGGSSGLGLYICKLLVGKMGGSIGMSSTLGAGSTFWFTLPAVEAVSGSRGGEN